MSPCRLLAASVLLALGSHAVSAQLAVHPSLTGTLAPASLEAGETATLHLCVANPGPALELHRKLGTDDAILLTLSVGERSSDLLANGENLACADVPEGWECALEVSGDAVRVELRSAAASVSLGERASACVQLSGARVNDATGVAFVDLEIRHAAAGRLASTPIHLQKTPSSRRETSIARSPEVVCDPHAPREHTTRGRLGEQPARIDDFETRPEMPAKLHGQAISLEGDCCMPAGYMILSESAEAPSGFEWTGETVVVDESDDWVHVADSTPRSEIAAAAVGDRVYVAGGRPHAGSPDPVTATLEAFDSASGEFVELADMPTARMDVALVAVGNTLLAIGGADIDDSGPLPEWSALAVVEEYDIAAGTWRTRSPMPTPRSLAAVGVVDDLVYVIGGYDADAGPSPNLDIVEVYDPAADRWEQRSPAPFLVAGARALPVDGKIWVPQQLTHVTWSYDPVTDTWSEAGTASHVVRGSMVRQGDRIFSLARHAVTGHPQWDVYLAEYALTTQRWTARTALPEYHDEVDLVQAGGRIFSVGAGISLTGTVVHEYLPPKHLHVHRKQ